MNYRQARGDCFYFSDYNTKVRSCFKRRRVTHQLIENGYIVRIREEGSVALRCCCEGGSIHRGEDVGERAGGTELCPGPSITGDPLALRRVYRSDVLISQLGERHGGRKNGRKSLPRSHKARELLGNPLLQCEHVSDKRCRQADWVCPREEPL